MNVFSESEHVVPLPQRAGGFLSLEQELRSKSEQLKLKLVFSTFFQDKLPINPEIPSRLGRV